MLDWWQDLWRTLSTVPHLGLYLTLGWLGYLVGLGLWIVLQKREPVATLSWLISLAALPYLGFVIYFVLGPQRINRQRLRRVRARAALPPPPLGFTPSPEAIELAKIAQAITGLPPTTATHAQLLIDGAAKYTALLAAVAQAREHVHLEYYIYQPDRTGTALRDVWSSAPAPGSRYGCCWTRSARARRPSVSCSRCSTPAAKWRGSTRCACTGSGSGRG